MLSNVLTSLFDLSFKCIFFCLSLKSTFGSHSYFKNYHTREAEKPDVIVIRLYIVLLCATLKTSYKIEHFMMDCLYSFTEFGLEF